MGVATRKSLTDRLMRYQAASAPSLMLPALSWEPCIDWFTGIGADLEVRAMMVGVITVGIANVIGHELNHLQRALRAVDVGNQDVRLLVFAERLVSHDEVEPS